MQNTDAYKKETIAHAFVSVEMVAAIVCMAFFWFTIVSFEGDSAATDKNDSTSVDVMAEVNTLKPMQLLNAGNLEMAMREASTLVQKKAHNAAANVCAGMVFVAAGAGEDGLRYLKKGVALSHRDKNVTLEYARALNQTKHTDEAVAQYQALVRIDPRWAVPHAELAQIYMDTKHPDEAAKELGALVDSNPNNFAARKLRGIALARSGKLKPGLEEYMLAIAQEGQSGPPETLRQMLGTAGASAMDRVIFELEQQVNNRPTEYVPKLRLAQLYTYGGNPKAAKDLLMDARRLAPQNAEVQRTLAVVLKQLGEDTQAMSAFGLSVKLEEQKEREKAASAAP